MTKRKTHEEFEKQIYDMYKGEYQCTSKYINGKTHIIMKHTCGNEYPVLPTNFLKGYKCPYCSKRPKITEEIFEKRVKEAHNGRIIPVDKYISIHKKIKFLHLDCNRTFFAEPNNVIDGYGCPYCANNRKKSIEEIKELTISITDGEYECISNSYENNKEKLIFNHLNCGNKYLARWANFTQGYRCPYCSDSNNSKGTKIIEKFLKTNGYKYVREKEYDDLVNEETNRHFRFDFFVPKFNLIIEFDGEQHFHSTGAFFPQEKVDKIKFFDSIKNKYCEDNSINLIRYDYIQLKNNELKNLLKEDFDFFLD